MENTAGRYEHLNRDEEGKCGYLFLHPAFPPAGPITVGFGFQSYSMVASKGTPMASAWQHPGPHVCAFSLYIMMCCMLDTSPSGLHGTCVQITGWGPQGYFFVSRTRWISRSPERGILLGRAACCQGLTNTREVMCCLLGTERRRIIAVLSFLMVQGNMSLKVCF